MQVPQHLEVQHQHACQGPVMRCSQFAAAAEVLAWVAEQVYLKTAQACFYAQNVIRRAQSVNQHQEQQMQAPDSLCSLPDYQKLGTSTGTIVAR